MATPSPRNSIRIARGLYADLLASISDLGLGELCYATDHDKFYTPNGAGGLLEVGKGTAIATIGQIGDVDVAGATSGQVLQYDGTEWVAAAAGGGNVDSVNGQVGVVVLDATDVGAVAPGDNVSDLANDAGYITSAQAPVQPGDIPTVGAGVITLESYGEGAGADSTFQMNQILNQTITLPQIRYTDLSDLPAAASSVTTSDTAPSNPSDGDLWYRSTDGRTYVYYDDGSSAQWVDASPAGVPASVLEASDIGTTVQAYDADNVVADVAPTFTATVQTTERTITAGAFDLATGNHWTCGAITVPAPANAASGTSGLIRITAGPITWNTVFKFPGGAAPAIGSFPAVIPFYVQDSSNILMGNVSEGIA